MSSSLVPRSEMHHVAVLHFVFFALYPLFPCFFCCRFSTERDIVFVGYRFGPNEFLFKVGVDDTRSLGGEGASADRPGTRLFRPGGEVGLQAQKVITRAVQAIESRLLKTKLAQEFLGFVVFESCEFGLNAGGNHDGLCALLTGFFGDFT